MKTRILIAAALVAMTGRVFAQTAELGDAKALLADAARQAGVAASPATAAEIEAQLQEAVKARQELRRWLFANGNRVTKELIAEAHGSFGTSFFLGLGGGGGSFSAEAYEDLLHGGERFIVTQLDPAAVSYFDAADVEIHKAPGWGACVSSIYYDFQRPRLTTSRISEMKEKLAKLQDSLTSLEGLTVRWTALPSQRAAFLDLRNWAMGSQIRLETISMTVPYAFYRDNSAHHLLSSEFRQGWDVIYCEESFHSSDGIDSITKHEGSDLPVY
jgi:hypothetical protein